MRFFNKALIVLSLASLFCVGGCKKTDAPKDTDEVVQALKSWNKSDVNSLLAYVPADAPAVFASTRQIDADHPAFKKFMEKILSYSDGMIKMMEKELAKNSDESAQKLPSLVKELRPLFENYSANAGEWGFDPKGHHDGVFYLNNGTFVAKLSLADSSKFKAKMDSIHAKAKELGEKDAEFPGFTELKAGSSTWYTYDSSKDIKDDDFKEFPSVLAYNLDNNIVTFTAIKSGDTASLEKVLKVSDNPLKKDALGKVEDDIVSLGYVDNIKLFDKLSTSESVKNLLKKESDFELSAVCAKDIASLVALIPRLSMVARIDKNGNAISEYALALSDKEEIKKLQALTVDHLDIGSDKSLATVNVNLNVDKGIAYLQDLVKRASERKFACEAMNPLIPKEWSDAVNELSSPKLKMFTSAISGVNAAVDKLDISNGKFEIEAVANVSGPTLSTSYSMLAGLASMGSPELGAMLALKKDEVKDIDLGELIEKPLKVKALLTDKDLIIGTGTYDVKALSTGKRVNDGAFLSYSYSTSIMKALSLDEFLDIPEAAGSMTLGINDEGFVIKTIANL